MDVSVFEGAPDLVAVLDAAGGQVWANRAWRAATDRRGTPIDSRSAWEAAHRGGRLRHGPFDVRVSATEDDLLLVVARDVSDLQVTAARLQEALIQKSVLLEEVHHRVKNNLQVVSSLLRMQARRVHDLGARSALDECRRRVQVMAGLHQQLTQAPEAGGVDIAQTGPRLVADLLSTLTPPGLDVEVQQRIAPSLVLPLNQAMPLALILHELVANALQHAWPGGGRGRLELDLGPGPDGSTVVEIRDDGRGMPGEAGTRSLGVGLVEALARQCGAILDRTAAPGPDGGTRWTLRIPPPAS